MGALAITAYFWSFMALTSLLLFPAAVVIRLVSAPFDHRLTVLHRFTSFWGSLYTWCNPLWIVDISGTEHLRQRSPCVMVANHQSFADIFLLFRLRTHYKWVSKAENFRIPLIGWNMSLNRYISIARGSVRGNLQMMRDCEKALLEGNSIMMFPEGTRSPDGRMRSFKDGAFELAVRTGSPVLPIVISGTSEALPKRGFMLRGRQRMRVRILPPLFPESFHGRDAHQLNQEVWAMMSTTLATGVVAARG